MRNAKNTDAKFFSNRFKSIYGLPYFKLKTPYFVRVDPYLVLNTENTYLVVITENPYCFGKNTEIPYLVLNTENPYFFANNTESPCLALNSDQNGQNTEFFSLKYGIPYID